MPGMTAASSSSTVKGVRSRSRSFAVSLGAGLFRSTFFLACARVCADAPSSVTGPTESVQSISPAAKAALMRSVCKVALRLGRAAFRQDFSICGALARAGSTAAECFVREHGGPRHAVVILRSCPGHPWVALQVPEQFPEPPWPRHVPPPRPLDRRPDPTALWPPAETLTVT